MSQIPILNGIYTDQAPDFRTSYPRNMVPVPKSQGISSGYLRPADGIVLHGTGPGVCRGSISWNGELYMVQGAALVRVARDGAVVNLGEIIGTGQVTMDYSFDCLSIAGGGRLYYWDGAALTSVTDPDIGNVVDQIWVDGYFMTTDGEYLMVTELNDRYSVNPLKYGSSEVDPDPVNPALALGMVQAMLSANPRGKDAAEALSKFGTEQRAGELHPSAVATAEAGAVKAGADAQTALVGAKFAESRAVKDLQLSDAQIKKWADDTEIARRNSQIAAQNAAIAREGNALKKRELEISLEEKIQKRDDKLREKVGDFQAGHATLQDAMGLIDEIKSNKVGLAGATGGTAWGSFMPGTPTRTVAGKIEQLQNILAAANLDKLKGPMSDKDIAFLKNIASNLDRYQEEGAFLKELDKVEAAIIRSEKMLRQQFGGKDAPPVPGTPPPKGDGKPKNVTVDLPFRGAEDEYGFHDGSLGCGHVMRPFGEVHARK